MTDYEALSDDMERLANENRTVPGVNEFLFRGADAIRELRRDLRGAMAIIEREGNRNDELNRTREALRTARMSVLEEAAALCDSFDERECCSAYCARKIRELKDGP